MIAKDEDHSPCPPPYLGGYEGMDGAGFQPLWGLRFGTWGVATGWYEGAPLALGEAAKGSAALLAALPPLSGGRK